MCRRRCFDQDMPRVRLTAGGWLTAALLGAGLCALPALAAPPGAGKPPVANKKAVGQAGARPADTEGRRREEIDELQRQDAADALKRHYNIDVDWRATSLDRLIDIRVRAAKAADLQQRLGVSVEWQRYSWIELEALRRTLLSFEQYRNADAPAAAAPPSRAAPLPHAEDTLVRPTFKERPPIRAGRSTDPDGIIRPTFTGRVSAPAEVRDPDGVIRPTFAVRPRWSSVSGDPDGLIAPTFAPTRRFAAIGDADDLIDPTRATEVRSVVPARW
jgi:hypothetical protein